MSLSTSHRQIMPSAATKRTGVLPADPPFDRWAQLAMLAHGLSGAADGAGARQTSSGPPSQLPNRYGTPQGIAS